LSWREEVLVMWKERLWGPGEECFDLFFDGEVFCDPFSFRGFVVKSAGSVGPFLVSEEDEFV
jgi:hypothetical protein